MSLACNLITALFTTVCGDHSEAWNPPERFDRPFTGAYTERLLPLAELQTWCQNDKVSLQGCAYTWTAMDGTPGCDVAIRRGPGAISVEVVRRHEIGHCNGWPGTHPR